jgi:hypothetical protein
MNGGIKAVVSYPEDVGRMKLKFHSIMALTDARKEDCEGFEELQKAFKSTSDDFIQLLEKLRLPTYILSRFKRYLVSASVDTIVDLFSGVVEASFEERLELLQIVGLKERMKLLIEYMSRQMQVSRKHVLQNMNCSFNVR